MLLQAVNVLLPLQLANCPESIWVDDQFFFFFLFFFYNRRQNYCALCGKNIFDTLPHQKTWNKRGKELRHVFFFFSVCGAN